MFAILGANEHQISCDRYVLCVNFITNRKFGAIENSMRHVDQDRNSFWNEKCHNELILHRFRPGTFTSDSSGLNSVVHN